MTDINQKIDRVSYKVVALIFKGLPPEGLGSVSAVDRRFYSLANGVVRWFFQSEDGLK